MNAKVTASRNSSTDAEAAVDQHARWFRFWFQGISVDQLRPIRIGVGIVALLQFLFYSANAANWFGPNGWFPEDVSLHFIGNGIEGTGYQYRLSILYYVPSASFAVAILGLLASLAMVVGFGSRLAPLGAWLAITQFHHRAPFLVELHEPLLAACLVYFLVHPGTVGWIDKSSLTKKTFGVSDELGGDQSILANVVIRLLQCHLLIWIAFSLASMLSVAMWWNGEAAWLLTQQTTAWLRLAPGQEKIGQALTHVVIASQVAIVASLIHPQFRPLGGWPWLVFIACILLLTGQWMYAGILSVWSQVFWPIASYLPFRGKNKAL